ncbi:hypothetical protein C8Q73DRAFT_540641 [Cubamyces lactineus]|nr:hypothetical protein C8Q73DRAFT_540641 [Cubamyces lactineus]
MCNTVYGATLDSDIVVSATIRLVDWDAQVVFSWFGRLVEMDTFHFGKCQDHFKLNNDYLYGAIFYCIILLYSMGEPSIAERFFANSASLQKDTIVAGFCECLDLLRYHIPQDVHEALPRWGEQVAWLLDTHAALHAREDKGHSDGHLEPSSLLSPPCQERLQSNRLDLTSTILDIEVIPESYKYKRISCIEFYATSAFHLLRASGYSPDKPFERIGAYLRAHAVLLNATATRPLWDPSNLEEPLDEALKDALSDLITALDSLARAGLDDLVDIADVRTDIIRPIAGIVDALSRKPDSFLPLLAPRFCTSLEAFFEALKQSVLFDDDYAIWVPGAVRTPSDLYDSARELIAKIRGQSGQSHNTHSLQYMFQSSYYFSHVADSNLCCFQGQWTH